jgi:hypothetical protein
MGRGCHSFLNALVCSKTTAWKSAANQGGGLLMTVDKKAHKGDILQYLPVL